eukprot:Gb_26402 [translate_table: standard]
MPPLSRHSISPKLASEEHYEALTKPRGVLKQSYERGEGSNEAGSVNAFGQLSRRRHRKLHNVLELHVVSNLATLLALTIGKWFSPGKCAVRSAINCAPSRGGLAIGIGAMENVVEVVSKAEVGQGGVCNGNENEAWMLRQDEVGCVDMPEDPNWSMSSPSKRRDMDVMKL